MSVRPHAKETIEAVDKVIVKGLAIVPSIDDQAWKSIRD